MIEPSKIQVSELPSVALEDKKQLPQSAVIYFAIANQSIQYIGKSVDARNRWRNHHRYHQLLEMGGARIAYLECDMDLLDQVEIALINHFRPPLNGVFVPAEKRIENREFPSRVNIRLTPEQKKKLCRVADAREQSIAEMLRAWIDGLEDMPIREPITIKRRTPRPLD